MNLKINIFFILAALLFASCSKERISANGQIVTETREPGTFTGIISKGSTPVHVIYGGSYRVELRGSSNLLPYFQTEVVNNKLILEFGRVNVSRSDVELFVTLPAGSHGDQRKWKHLYIRHFPLSRQLHLSIAARVTSKRKIPLLWAN